MILLPVSIGEAIDRETILYIKSQRVTDPEKLRNINAELLLVADTCNIAFDATTAAALAELRGKLLATNDKIWDIEDAIRECERTGDFSQKFIDLARGVYHNNDERSRLKREINMLLGSTIIEEKSYTDYGNAEENTPHREHADHKNEKTGGDDFGV